jgi:signal peptidase II
LLSFDQKSTYNVISLLILLINLIIIYLIYNEKSIKTYFLLVILGGSFGNLFDRIYYNAVPDFIDLNYKGYHWFIFNVADIFITLGILCLIFSELLNYKK